MRACLFFQSRLRFTVLRGVGSVALLVRFGFRVVARFRVHSGVPAMQQPPKSLEQILTTSPQMVTVAI